MSPSNLDDGRFFQYAGCPKLEKVENGGSPFPSWGAIFAATNRKNFHEEVAGIERNKRLSAEAPISSRAFSAMSLE
jgi:hypothetical protein